MNKLTTLLILLFISSCNPLYDVTKKKSAEKIKIVESTSQWKRQQGETIILPYPKSPNKIFRDTVVQYITKKGAKVATSYDDKGNIDNQVIICPDSEETKQTDLKASYSLKQTEIERQMNIELALVIRNGFVAVGFFFALAYYLKKN